MTHDWKLMELNQWQTETRSWSTWGTKQKTNTCLTSILMVLLDSSFLAPDGIVTEYRTFPRLVFPLFFNVFVSCFISRGYGSRRSFPCPIPSRSPLLWLCRGVLQARRGNAVRWHHPQSSALARNARPVPPCLVFPSPLCPYMFFFLFPVRSLIWFPPSCVAFIFPPVPVPRLISQYS